MQYQVVENMTAVGYDDISDLMMIIRWVMNISSWSPELECQFNTQHPTYCDENKEGNRENNYILDTFSTEYTQQAFSTPLLSFTGWV